MEENFIKCVAVGDGFVGKTTFLARLCQKEIEENYAPTIFDNHSITTVHNSKSYQVLFVDTAGQEGYSLLRKQVYESTHVFLVCFSIDSTSSFANVKQSWLPEIDEYPDASRILIGTKSDLRNDLETIDKLNASAEIFVSQSVAVNFANSHNMKYVECSSTTQENIDEVLKTILEVHCAQKVTKSNTVSSSPCCVNPILRFLRKAICCKNKY